jgi:thiamine biosynthesis lipoprotein
MNVARFRAMNTDVSFIAPGNGGSEFEQAVEVARQTFEEVEASLSRFRPDSELCALNRAAGSPFRASPLLLRAVSLAVDAAKATDGIFDPSVLPALEAAGYDRSFEQLTRGAVSVLAPPPVRDYRAIRLDFSTSTIALDVGQRIDLGGIGKGMAVDLALGATANLPDRCINAGGDVAVRGAASAGEGWTIELEDSGDLPGGEAPLSITIADSGVATSTITRRSWKRGASQYHHLIDPRTGLPSTSPFRTVTAVARSCVEADVAAKTALLLGEDGLAFLDSQGMHGFAVRRDGSAAATSHWPWS